MGAAVDVELIMIFPRRTILTPDDIKVLTNPVAGTRLGWKEKNVPVTVPEPTENPPEAMLTTDDFFLDIYEQGEMTLLCRQCGEKGAKVERMHGRTEFRPFHEVVCRSCHFRLQNKPKVSNAQGLSGYPVYILKIALNCLLGEVKFDSYASILRSMSMRPMSKSSFNRILNLLYVEQKSLFDSILEANRKQVMDFYDRNGKGKVNGKYNITVSCDGSYPKRSYINKYDSRYCISFIVEDNLGLVVDYVILKRCTNKKHMKKTGWQGDRCEDKNFHGSAKSLEVGCALRLFEKSVEDEDYPFRYMTLVGDGDSNVIKNILKENFYGDEYQVEKEECLFHLRKSVRTRLYGVFDKLYIFERKVEKKDTAYEKLGPDDFNKRRVFKKETCLTYQNRFAN